MLLSCDNREALLDGVTENEMKMTGCILIIRCQIRSGLGAWHWTVIQGSQFDPLSHLSADWNLHLQQDKTSGMSHTWGQLHHLSVQFRACIELQVTSVNHHHLWSGTVIWREGNLPSKYSCIWNGLPLPKWKEERRGNTHNMWRQYKPTNQYRKVKKYSVISNVNTDNKCMWAFKMYLWNKWAVLQHQERSN